MQDCDGCFDFEAADIEYLRFEHPGDDEKGLLARVYQPIGDGPFPMMINLHGGAWCHGDRHNDKLLCEALARSGVVVAALDFRQPPDAAYPDVMADIHFATRWLKSNAAQFNGRPGSVGIFGISSGGQQAMLAAMKPDDTRFAATTRPDVACRDAGLGCVVLCWPVIDPLGRYEYAKQRIAADDGYPAQLRDVLPCHDRYWGSPAQMADGSPVHILERRDVIALPPVLYVQGREDQMHPIAHLERFVALYEAQGGAVDVALYDGEVEGFVTRTPHSPANQKAATSRIIEFVHEQLG